MKIYSMGIQYGRAEWGQDFGYREAPHLKVTHAPHLLILPYNSRETVDDVGVGGLLALQQLHRPLKAEGQLLQKWQVKVIQDNKESSRWKEQNYKSIDLY